MHRPDRRNADPGDAVGAGRIWSAGKVRCLGAANFFEREICRISAQDHYSLMFRDIEKPMEPFCVKYGMGMNSYFPLAGELLTGKYPPPAYFGMERSLSGVRILPLRQT